MKIGNLFDLHQFLRRLAKKSGELWSTNCRDLDVESYPPKCKIWPDFGRLRSLAANISGMDEDVRNRSSTWSTTIPPALGETSPVNFGPVTLEISMWNWTHLKRIFRKTLAPKGCYAPKFLHALENDQVLLAHLPPGTEVPLQSFSSGRV